MHQSPDIVQRALHEATRLNSGSPGDNRSSVAVITAIRDRLVGLESDLRQSEDRAAACRRELRSAREEGAQAATLHAKQLIAASERAAAEIDDVKEVAARAIADIEASAQQEFGRLRAENVALRDQLAAKTREADGLSEALSDLLSGIQQSQLTHRREREEVDILISGLMELMPQNGVPMEAASSSFAANVDIFSAVENLVLGEATPSRPLGEVIPLRTSRAA